MRARKRRPAPVAGKVEKTRGWAAIDKLLNKMSQTEIANRAKVAQSAISSIWSLDSLPSRETMWRLEEAFGIKQAWWRQKLAGAAA